MLGTTVQEHRIMVNPREEDRRFAATLGSWVLGALDLLGGHLLGLTGGSDSDEQGAAAGHLPPGGRPLSCIGPFVRCNVQLSAQW